MKTGVGAFQRIDFLFGKSFGLRMNGKNQTTSCIGSVFSLIIYVLVLTYSVRKVLIMEQFDDTKHQFFLDVDGLNQT